MQSILSVTFEDFQKKVQTLGIPSYRLTQIFEWIYQKGATSFQEMTNLPFDLREKLSKEYEFPKMEHEVFTSVDGTKKFRFKLSDGKIIESVWMPEEKRNTLCISSQVGCAMKCAFCVTGAIGFMRNLTALEIISQVWFVKMAQKLPVSNVVFMGMGEPLQNFNNVVESIAMLTDKKRIAVGKRKITVSTVGLVPKMREFVEKTDVKLAISVTGTNDQDRDHWMPINKTYNWERLVKELKTIPLPFGKKFTFEVVMLKGETDTEKKAQELAAQLKGLPAKVNLIPYNENPFFPDLKTPTPERIEKFQQILINSGIPAMIRKNRGTDIMGACGQLAGKDVTI